MARTIRSVVTLLLDTHAWVWSLGDTRHLTPRALGALLSGQPLAVSAASIYEVANKVRLGKWPEAAALGPDLIGMALRQGVEVLPILPEVALRAAVLDWPHRDPFDRFIAATAQVHNLTLMSKDQTLDSVPGGLRRLW